MLLEKPTTAELDFFNEILGLAGEQYESRDLGDDSVSRILRAVADRIDADDFGDEIDADEDGGQELTLSEFKFLACHFSDEQEAVWNICESREFQFHSFSGELCDYFFANGIDF